MVYNSLVNPSIIHNIIPSAIQYKTKQIKGIITKFTKMSNDLSINKDVVIIEIIIPM
jgi:hypothetical protein